MFRLATVLARTSATVLSLRQVTEVGRKGPGVARKHINIKEITVATYNRVVSCKVQNLSNVPREKKHVFVVSIFTKRINVQFLACTELITHANVTLCVCVSSGELKMEE